MIIMATIEIQNKLSKDKMKMVLDVLKALGITAIITTEETEETDLEKRIISARKEKKAGELKTVNPKNVWESI